MRRPAPLLRTDPKAPAVPDIPRAARTLACLLVLATATAGADEPAAPAPPCDCGAATASLRPVPDPNFSGGGAETPLRPVPGPIGHGPDDEDQCYDDDGNEIDPPCGPDEDGEMHCYRCTTKADGVENACDYTCDDDVDDVNEACFKCDQDAEGNFTTCHKHDVDGDGVKDSCCATFRLKLLPDDKFDGRSLSRVGVGETGEVEVIVAAGAAAPDLEWSLEGDATEDFFWAPSGWTAGDRPGSFRICEGQGGRLQNMPLRRRRQTERRVPGTVRRESDFPGFLWRRNEERHLPAA